MRRRTGRGRMVAVTVSAAVLAVSVTLIIVADDKGSAGAGVLVGLLGTVVSLFSDRITSVLRPARQRHTELRVALLAEARDDREELRRTLPPNDARIALSAIRVGGAGVRVENVNEPVGLFRSAADRLAITGEPGSGKTTTAIRLFEDLVDEARADEERAVPVFLRLSTWDTKYADLKGWLVDQIGQRFSLSEREATDAVRYVVPFLDGLDEVSEAGRTECARAIERYLQRMPNAPMVLCCRSREFDELSLSSAGSSLLVVRLSGLSATDLRGFFTGLDEQTWAPLTAELARNPSGALARVLTSPLMASLVRVVWGRGDPAELVRVSAGRGLDEPQTRALLWDHWTGRISRTLTDAEQAGAIGTAIGLTEAGTSEIRIQRLGRPATRWAWYLVKAVVVAAIASFTAPAFAVFVFIANFQPAIVRATGRLPGTVTQVARTGGLWLSVVVTLVFVFLFPDPYPPAAIGLALGSAALAAWPREEVSPLAVALRNTHGDAFRAMRRACLAPLAVLAGIWLVLMAIYAFLTGGIPPFGLVIVSSLIAIYGASFAGLDFAGYHLLARSWHRLVRRVRLKSLLNALVEAGMVQRTSQSYRFFHVELQRHLSTRESRSTVSFHNVGVGGFLQDAVNAANQGDLALAVDLLRRVTRVLPSADLSLSLGIYLSLLGSLDESLVELDRAVERNPDAPAPATYRAGVLHRLGRPDDALAEYDRALALDPARGQAHAGRAAVLADAGRTEEALAAYDRADTLSPDDAEVQGARGDFLSRINRFDDALAAYDRAAALDPERGWFHYARASTLTSLGRPEDALAALDRTEALVPENSLIHCERGRALGTLQRYEEALAAYDRSLAVDQGHSLNVAAVEVDRGGLLALLGRPDEALAAYDRAVELDPDDADAHGDRGELLRGSGRWAEALAAYDRALAAEPDRPGFHLLRGSVLTQLGRPAEALEALERAETLAGEHPVIGAERGVALQTLHRYRDALAALDRTVELDPDSAPAHTARGSVLSSLGRPADALAALDRAAELVPGDPDAEIRRALVLEELDRPQEALAAADTAVRAAPDAALVHVLHAMVLAGIGRTADADAALDRAGTLAPDDPLVGFGRAEVLRRSGRFAEALPIIDEVIGREPGQPGHLTTRGQILHGLGRTDEAVEVLEEALRLAPEIAETRTELERVRAGTPAPLEGR